MYIYMSILSDTNGSVREQVCLSMYDDHNLRKCAATTCCSAYVNDLADVGGSGFKPGGAGAGPPGGGQSGGFFGDLGKGPGDSGGGSGPIVGGRGEQCAVDISGPGTFIGKFQPRQLSSAAQAELLSISRRFPGDKSSRALSSSSPVLGANSGNLRMNKEVVFRGMFVPASALPTSAKTSSESPSSLPTPDAFETSPENARNTLSNNIRVPSLLPKPRDLESRVGAPGGPGGEDISIASL